MVPLSPISSALNFCGKSKTGNQWEIMIIIVGRVERREKFKDPYPLKDIFCV